jgi:hypothetical protein
LNSGQRKILIAIIAYTIIWNSQYLCEYLPGLFDMEISLLLMITIVALVLIGIYQVYKEGLIKEGMLMEIKEIKIDKLE